ncbi:hypothetical protein F511_38736 [Dorcoceras hygrometricum]|uniref:Uncharacterized protein n=1 Tax=Dorcoceras hygrometricum TaxID=472368 RepID=A0A2Z7C718_9LAMI|nr:hypothetical protein F511_38736 [Dorcoceras hygrometricum]
MTFRVVRTNQYNQDLGLIHSTNGNHLENPNEGSSIDHQVTIHLHAQNITMFPINETCCACLLIGVARSSPGARLGDWVFTEVVLIKSSSGTFLRRKKGRHEERSAGARRPAGELNNDDVSSNVSNQQEATAQTSSWYWKLAIAKRCRLNKSIRQRFRLRAKDSADGLCDDQTSSYWTVKPALTNKEFSSWTFSKANPTADDLVKQFQQQRFSNNDQAVTTQQRCKISNNANSAEATSSSP